MTEERNIISYATIERTFDKAGDAKAQWLMIRAISEPALPKDWRPACWTGDLKNDLNGCTELYYKEDGAIYKPCLSCPYRKWSRS